MPDEKEIINVTNADFRRRKKSGSEKKKDYFTHIIFVQFVVIALLMGGLFAVKKVSPPNFEILKDTYTQIMENDMTVKEVFGKLRSYVTLPQGGDDISVFSAQNGTSFSPYYISGEICTPVSGTISSPFGYRINPVTKTFSFHSGLDIAADEGEKIKAAYYGTVSRVDYDDTSGNYIEITHSDGLVTRYLHCSKIIAEEGMVVRRGETIALVGLNGAGKTTLTMLMCGLFMPDEGEVLLDGHPLTDYNRDEIYALFGFVPQNYHLLPVSIARNIASAMTDDEINREKLEYCIETAGLAEKIASLTNGADTLINREVNCDGIELSGGETQKLLLARLLYKNPPCIILDEPTAALDPIAEDRMYRRYNEIAANATSVFISHRLASTRFCDRIFLLDGASFAEVGTHDELMETSDIYRDIYRSQLKEGGDING